MIASFLTTFFNRFYVVLKLNLYFWLLTIMGGVIFGIGPAFLTIVKLFQAFRWEYQELTWGNVFSTFKSSYKRGNFFFGGFLLLGVILSYNLYFSLQINHLIFLIIDFLLIFALFLMAISFLFMLFIESQYEATIKNVWKLSLLLFFMDFWTLLKLGGVLVAVSILTFYNPALILFGSISLFIILASFISNKLFTKLNEKLVYVS
ncbi:DUF624 domain-containing protein [Niallia sp.]|uniref:YesL family protein n=1 Tax=Niallia sp. TaxID=2837523 RepID=UPI0028982626|nr:DUF624 domain-containing protein [Niallia sp.]